MRYREGQEIPDDIPPQIGDAFMSFAAVLGLLIGIVLFYLAKKGKQLWLLTWSAGLVVASLGYLSYLVFK